MNLDYGIQDTKFSVKIYYYTSKFVHLVKQYTMDMIEAIKSNRILRYSGWRTEAVSVNHSNCCVSIAVIKVHFLKKNDFNILSVRLKNKKWNIHFRKYFLSPLIMTGCKTL